MNHKEAIKMTNGKKLGEGKIKKGGLNPKPSSPRPPAPPAQKPPSPSNK
jgi:hypothetical protein